ncbi:hypothetical protein [Kitasatospora sp. NPDC087314]|uniref:hypothetical protein n=1 Tax=Kitasatospora sp. NPDC087314 TaxID=3364068 RepID=UPI00381C735C
MRLSLPAGLLAGCTVALLLQPAATADPAGPDGVRLPALRAAAAHLRPPDKS